MTPSRTPNAVGRKLDKLRIVVAPETFCNRINRDSDPTDISLKTALHELSGQYYLSICLNWLATKYGFPIYTPGINPGFHADLQRLPTWEFAAERYPLNTPEDMRLTEAAGEAGFRYLDQTFDPDVELIGQMYIRLLCERSKGEFYTPKPVVDRCVEVACEGWLPERVVDPACGTGNFLLGVLRHARRFLQGERLLEFARDSIGGLDIDGRAVSLAKFALLIELSQELAAAPEALPELVDAFDAHLQVADALYGEWPLASPDLVITNPPYISYGSRNQPQLSPSQSVMLRRAFPASSEYKVRLHSIFQELALRHVRQAGTTLLLVPDAFLTGAYYKKLRRLISEQAHVEALCELPESTFSDAVAGRWCIAKYRKGIRGEYTTIQQFDGRQLQRHFRMHTSELVDPSDKYRFQIVFCAEDAQVLRDLRRYPRLADYARGHTGIRARKGQESIIANSRMTEAHRRGLTSGASVHQHYVKWDGKWLHVEPSLLFAGGFDRKVIERPKILMRQTADRIIAAVDEDGLYHLNNIHSFSPISDGPPDWIYFLCGVMNSSLWLHLYQLRSRERKRALAQIDIEMIESMPIAEADKPTVARIAALVRQVAVEQIDAEVFDLYEIDSSTRRHIVAERLRT
jgi:adenine-specific DNA-methyltransferase